MTKNKGFSVVLFKKVFLNIKSIINTGRSDLLDMLTAVMCVILLIVKVLKLTFRSVTSLIR